MKEPWLTKTNKLAFLLRFAKNDVPLQTLFGLPLTANNRKRIGM